MSTFDGSENKETGPDKYLHEPFIGLAIGPRKSGKSYFAKNYLREKLIHIYDEIHILSCSIDLNADYDEFRRKKYQDQIIFHKEFTPETLEEIVRAAEEEKEEWLQLKRGESIYACNKGVSKTRCSDPLYKVDEPDDFYLRGEFSYYNKPPRISNRKKKQTTNRKNTCKKTLIILDDCVDAGILRYLSTIDRIAMRGRHALVSLFAIAQRITPISVNVRDNADFIILFNPATIQEFESLVDKFIPKTFRRMIRPKLEAIFDVAHEFLLLDNMDHGLYTKLKSSNTNNFLNNIWDKIDLRDYMGF